VLRSPYRDKKVVVSLCVFVRRFSLYAAATVSNCTVADVSCLAFFLVAEASTPSAQTPIFGPLPLSASPYQSES
jgi:hypothetical protein